MNKIIFGITTYNSIDYALDNLSIIINEIVKTPYNNKDIYISSNGMQNYYKIEKIVNELKKMYSCANIKLINLKKKGKNNALNAILKKAKSDDICYFIDDDIAISSLTIESNIECLIKNKIEREIPVIVGPNFKVIDNNLSLFQKIISLPYLMTSKNSPFVMGGALTFYRKDFDFYPNDENIADDGYIGNYFLKYLYDNNLTNERSNIIKDSYAYFQLSNNFTEWENQQIRILIGVENSYECFGSKYINYFKEKCKWEYSFGNELRKPVKWNIRLGMYRILQKLVMKKLEKVSNDKVSWENIYSTKKLKIYKGANYNV